MTGHALTVDVIGFLCIDGRNKKTQAFIAGAPFAFPCRAFLPQPPFPLFAPHHAGYISLLTGNWHIRTMTNQNNVILYFVF